MGRPNQPSHAVARYAACRVAGPVPQFWSHQHEALASSVRQVYETYATGYVSRLLCVKPTSNGEYNPRFIASMMIEKRPQHIGRHRNSAVLGLVEVYGNVVDQARCSGVHCVQTSLRKAFGRTTAQCITVGSSSFHNTLNGVEMVKRQSQSPQMCGLSAKLLLPETSPHHS